MQSDEAGASGHSDDDGKGNAASRAARPSLATTKRSCQFRLSRPGCTSEQEQTDRQFESGACEGFGKAAFIQYKRRKPEQASAEP